MKTLDLLEAIAKVELFQDYSVCDHFVLIKFCVNKFQFIENIFYLIKFKKKIAINLIFLFKFAVIWLITQTENITTLLYSTVSLIKMIETYSIAFMLINCLPLQERTKRTNCFQIVYLRSKSQNNWSFREHLASFWQNSNFSLHLFYGFEYRASELVDHNSK